MQFTLAGDLTELRQLSDEIARFCQSNGLASDVEFDLNLVLEELFTNTLKHGGGAGASEAARTVLELDGDDVAVEYSDHGAAFNPIEAPSVDLTAPLANRATGGLGIHLVRQTMQDLEYQRADGWNRLTMRRPVDATSPKVTFQ